MRRVSGRGRFRFVGPTGKSSSSLAEVAANCAISPIELARYGALLGPVGEGATIYRGVTWSYEDDAAPRGYVPTDSEARARPIETMRAAIDDAVERLAGDALRVAVVTGGGLDSGGLLTYAVRWSKRRPGRSVFAIGCDFEAAGDDRPHLRALVEHLGCEVLRITPEDAAPYFHFLQDGIDAAPFVWPTSPFEIAILEVAKAHGAEIALSGVGGDELLDGSPGSLALPFASGKPREAWATARMLAGFDRPRFAALQWLVRPHVAKRVPRWVRARRMRRVWEPPEFAGPTLRAAYARTAEEEAARILRGIDAETEIATRRHRFGVGFLRHQESFAGALERRDPFFDLGLVASISTLPPDLLLHGARRRGLFRETLRGEVPESFRLRMDKSSFTPAVRRSLDASGGFSRWHRFADAPRLAAMGIVDSGSFRRAYDRLVADPSDGAGWATTFLTLTMEAFLATRDA